MVDCVPSQVIWNWHTEWKYFFDRKHPPYIYESSTDHTYRPHTDIETGEQMLE